MHRWRAISLLLFLLAPVLALATPPPPPGPGELQVHFIDVGQGSAILLRTADAAVLVDAGGDATAAEYLQELEITRLNLAVASHAHADHVGGFPAVFRSVAVDEIWYNGQTHTTRTFERFIDAVIASGAVYREPLRWHRAAFRDLHITVLHPDESAADYSGHLHDRTIVVRGDFRDFSVILTSDAHRAVEAQMIAARVPLAATVLALGHHGSNTSSSAAFLRAVNPVVAVYQAGADNRYGHPHTEVIERVRGLTDAQILGTDKTGTVLIVTDGAAPR